MIPTIPQMPLDISKILPLGVLKQPYLDYIPLTFKFTFSSFPN